MKHNSYMIDVILKGNCQLEEGERPHRHTFGGVSLSHREPLVAGLNQSPQNNTGIKKKKKIKKGGSGKHK